ncbi:hypothetical protein FQN05_12950 [Corynebacterium aurimucosum]|uniref:Uncharacterized protein n=1 Tax=Corynebacterium aurimucosum TaxID=169292 RepID=A0A558IH31_9CORY|nr:MULTISPECIES: hypothetical protein [Corynebacterium]OHO52382.1 hypothetical protein HMPREF2635_10550 [Corynebacterium sp. HMSC035E02]TVU80675.1 hypothetical protein FQN05_12950 [Corynebacterium aurimucosum]
MDQPTIDPHVPNEPQQPADPNAPKATQDPNGPQAPKASELPPRRGWEGVFNEKLALWGSAILLAGWALGLLSLLIADSAASGTDDAASYMFGFLGIFTFIGLCIATPFLATLFAFIAIASLDSDVPERKRNARIALVLAILSIVPIVVYFGPKYMF